MKKQTKVKPKAVLISDLHFTPATLDVASEALRLAKLHAIDLKVPLVLCGDTLDSKAIMRAECVNRLIEIFSEYLQPIKTYVIVGNHDLLNEKGTAHSLEFLKPYVNVVDGKLRYSDNINAFLLPYHSSTEELQRLLQNIKNTNVSPLIICHQGVQTAYMGHYIQDKTSLPPEAFADFRVISGHYHRAQNIKCGRPQKGGRGLFSYVGTAYTTSFAEANDGPKGFQILMSDGTLEPVPTNLRKHMIVELSVNDVLRPLEGHRSGDIVWVKVTGSTSQLASLKKKDLGLALIGHEDFKLELIPNNNNKLEEIPRESMSDSDVFDSIIDTISDEEEHRKYLKILWKDVINENS